MGNNSYWKNIGDMWDDHFAFVGFQYFRRDVARCSTFLEK